MLNVFVNVLSFIILMQQLNMQSVKTCYSLKILFKRERNTFFGPQLMALKTIILQE